MARALDICDFQVPGQHIGSSIVPVALGIAEAKGDVSGRDIITALAVGSEIAIRLGYASRLDGFDPTGACSIFARSEEHTSELQSLMRISYAVFCLKKKKHTPRQH